MNTKTYRPRHPTTQQKEAAHNLYANEKDDAPKSDLFWTEEQQAEFRREAGLPAGAKEYYSNRPSRAAPRTFMGDNVPLSAAYEHAEAGAFNGQLHGRDAVLRFIRAGNATVTVVSKATGTRFSYKFQRPKEWQPGPQRSVAPVFCKVMTGADNNSDFEFVGTMWPEDSRWPDGAQVYRHGKVTRIGLSAPSVRALVWFLRTALHPDRERDLGMCEVWHEGRCGRCGRKLTVPSSIASGYGPECEGRL